MAVILVVELLGRTFSVVLRFWPRCLRYIMSSLDFKGVL